MLEERLVEITDSSEVLISLFKEGRQREIVVKYHLSSREYALHVLNKTYPDVDWDSLYLKPELARWLKLFSKYGKVSWEDVMSAPQPLIFLAEKYHFNRLSSIYNRLPALCELLGWDLKQLKARSAECRVRRTRESLKARFGVENVSQLPSVKEKKEKVVLEKWGSVNYFNSSVWRNQNLNKWREEQMPAYLSLLKERGLTLLDSEDYLVENHNILGDEIHVRHTCGYEFSGKFPNKLWFRYCPQCIERSFVGKWENEVADFLRGKGLSVIQSYRKFKWSPVSRSPFEIDLYLPDFKVGIELNGRYFHCSGGLTEYSKPRDYHQKKSRVCRREGVRLYQFWDETPVEFITNFLGKRLALSGVLKVPARKCEVETDAGKIQDFYRKEHILGASGPSDYSVALSWEGSIVSAMTFRYSRGTINNVRYCNSGYEVLGGFDRLMFLAKKHYGSGTFITYCNRDLSPEPEDTVYFRKGWKLESEVAPLLSYWKPGEGVVSREFLMKKKLKARFSDLTDADLAEKTEQEICIEHGYLPCYNSGAWKFSLEFN